MSNKVNNKPITINDILKRKEQFKKRRNIKKTFYVDSLDGNIVCKVPDTETITDALDMTEGKEGDMYLVYNCVIEPNLKAPELQEQFEDLISPMYIVEELFTPGEISSLAMELVKLAGYTDSVKLVDEIKN